MRHEPSEIFAISEQQAATKYPFSWDEGDGTGEPRLLAGSSEASKASTSVEQNHKGSPRTAVGHSCQKETYHWKVHVKLDWKMVLGESLTSKIHLL